MKPTINNEWITLQEKRNGVTVQRKFAGLDTRISKTNEVDSCLVLYWERELYPNGEVIKEEIKKYSLEDLAYTEIEIDGLMYRMQPLPVLTGFINSLGYYGIINPARETLEDTNILPLNVENGYPLRLNTRDKTPL
jgi:hypothetical protein